MKKAATHRWTARGVNLGSRCPKEGIKISLIRFVSANPGRFRLLPRILIAIDGKMANPEVGLVEDDNGAIF